MTYFLCIRRAEERRFDDFVFAFGFIAHTQQVIAHIININMKQRKKSRSTTASIIVRTINANVLEVKQAKALFAGGMHETLTAGMRSLRWKAFLVLSSLLAGLGKLLFGQTTAFAVFLCSVLFLFVMLPELVAAKYISESLASDMLNLSQRYGAPAESNFWVAVAATQKVVGTVAVESPNCDGHDPSSPWNSATDLELRRMSVSSTVRGKGIAKQMFQTLEAHCIAQKNVQRIVLSTSSFQASAVQMYPKLGFNLVKKVRLLCGLFTVYYFAKKIVR